MKITKWIQFIFIKKNKISFLKKQKLQKMNFFNQKINQLVSIENLNNIRKYLTLLLFLTLTLSILEFVLGLFIMSQVSVAKVIAIALMYLMIDFYKGLSEKVINWLDSLFSKKKQL